jgi:hypothetical protein
MRFEKWRGMSQVLTLAAALGLGLALASSVRADGYHLHYTIPRSVDAYDFTTGGPYMAPPIPYGHYAKDYLGSIQKCLGCATCGLHGMLGCNGCGHGLCNGAGCGHGLCLGLFGHGASGSGCVVPGCPGGPGCGHLGGNFHGEAVSTSPVVGPGPYPSSPVVGPGPYLSSPVVGPGPYLPTGQAVVQPPYQAGCGLSGCGLTGHHSHHGGGIQAGCDDPGCGLCHGRGHGGLCGFCGGKGCHHCLSGLAGMCSNLHARLAGLLYHQKVEYFLGAGGPVPLTPGYVPYIVVTRSPRDYFAFPPRNPNDP